MSTIQITSQVSTDELLQLINRSVPIALQSRYDELAQKQRTNTLILDEHTELLQVIDQIEQFDAERVQHLVTLAQLRQVSLDKLMQDLGIIGQSAQGIVRFG